MIYVARAFVLTPRTGVWTASGCQNWRRAEQGMLRGVGCFAAVRVDAGSDLPPCGCQVGLPLSLTYSRRGKGLLVPTNLQRWREACRFPPTYLSVCCCSQTALHHDNFGLQRGTRSTRVRIPEKPTTQVEVDRPQTPAARRDLLGSS